MTSSTTSAPRCPDENPRSASCSPGWTTSSASSITQRDNIIASIQQLNRVAGTFAGQRDVIDRALKDIPPALDVLIKERPKLTTALVKLGQFSDTATGLVNDAGADLVTDLKNLEPTLKALADIGPDLSLCADLGDGLSIRTGLRRHHHPRRLHQPDRNLRPDLSAAEEDAVPRHSVGRRECQTHSGTGRSLLPELLLQPDVGRCRAATR